MLCRVTGEFPGHPKITNCSFIGSSSAAIQMIGDLATLIWAIETEFVVLLGDLSSYKGNSE